MAIESSKCIIFRLEFFFSSYFSSSFFLFSSSRFQLNPYKKKVDGLSIVALYLRIAKVNQIDVLAFCFDLRRLLEPCLEDPA